MNSCDDLWNEDYARDNAIEWAIVIVLSVWTIMISTVPKKRVEGIKNNTDSNNDRYNRDYDHSSFNFNYVATHIFRFADVQALTLTKSELCILRIDSLGTWCFGR